MEERILDDEDARLVKIKRTKNGDDVVADNGEEPSEGAEQVTAEGENDYTVEFPEDEEYDEELVGLTPSQLQEVLERRERAKRKLREDYEECVRAGKECLEKGDFDGAAEQFALASSYLSDEEEAQLLLWTARTKNFTDLEAYYDKENARDFSYAPDSVKREVLSRDGQKLEKERENLAKEIAPLKEQVLRKQEERREPLTGNRNYYRLRLCILLVCVVCFAIASGVSGYYTVRTTSIAPVVTCIVFGAGAGISLIFGIFYTRFWLVATRLYNANENLASTEEGKALLALEAKEDCLALILDEPAENEEAED